MENKNPWLAGLFNSLVPGSGFWYVNRDRERFLRALIFGVVAIGVMIVLGNIVERTSGFPLSQGLCPGILLLLVLVPLFRSGHKAAVQHNSVLGVADRFTARQSGSNEAQLEKNQHLRDKGMISEQEFDSRKDSINRKK